MLVRGYIVNEFDEKVGYYDINGKNEYCVSMYYMNKGYMTENELYEYINYLGLYLEESRVVYNKIGKAYGER